MGGFVAIGWDCAKPNEWAKHGDSNEKKRNCDVIHDGISKVWRTEMPENAMANRVLHAIAERASEKD